MLYEWHLGRRKPWGKIHNWDTKIFLRHPQEIFLSSVRTGKILQKIFSSWKRTSYGASCTKGRNKSQAQRNWTFQQKQNKKKKTKIVAFVTKYTSTLLTPVSKSFSRLKRILAVIYLMSVCVRLCDDAELWLLSWLCKRTVNTVR